MIKRSQWQRDILGLQCPPGDVVQIIIKRSHLNYTALSLYKNKKATESESLTAHLSKTQVLVELLR